MGGNKLRMHFRFVEASHDADFCREARIPSYHANKKEIMSIGHLIDEKEPPKEDYPHYFGDIEGSLEYFPW